MSHPLPQFPLLQFTFYSLQFCGAPVQTWRGHQLLSAVQEWYLPFIQGGTPVPLSLSIDLAWMLMNPRDSPHGFVPPQIQTQVSSDVLELSSQYRQTLDAFRQQDDFQFATELVQTTHDEQRRTQVIKTFLETVFAPISGIGNVYSFTTRDLKIDKIQITTQGAAIGIRMPNGTVKTGNVRLGVIHKIAETPEGRMIRDVLGKWVNYFQSHTLSQVLSSELKIVLELTATTRFGKGRVDYLFLNWILNRPVLDEVEEEDPVPQMVDEEIPTNPYQTEGQTGGYIDIQRRKFSGSLGSVLPSELGLWRVQQLMLQKLLNEGMLTYVRESFEFIDRELRLLFCFVVDNGGGMMQPDRRYHPDLPKGLTPYMRGRSLAALMSRDLCRFLPRKDVFADAGIYLWSPQSGNQQRAETTCPAEMNLFDLNRTMANDRFRFMRYLMSLDPELFYSRISEAEADVRTHLERNPDEFVQNRHRNKRYHGRHIILLTSSETSHDLLSGMSLELDLGMTGSDSLLVVHCDVDESTYGLECPDYFGSTSVRSQVSEEFLRKSFLEMVIAKAAGKPMTNELLQEMEMLA